MNQVSIKTPLGLEASFTVPDDLDIEVSKAAFLSILGTFSAISRLENESDKREFYLRYVAALAAEANTAIRSCQMASHLQDKSSSKIIEDLLKSLKHDSKEEPNDKKE